MTRNIGDTTAFQRSALIAAVNVVRRFRPRDGNILFLTNKLCVKFGDLSEAFNLQFIAEHTSIPVPRVHCAFVHNGCAYILMDRIKGQMIGCGWESRSEESKTKIFNQLRKMVDEMRSLPAPGRSISSAIGGPLYDFRFTSKTPTVGPFDNIHDFHRFIRNGLQEPPERYPEIGDLMRWQDQTDWPLPVFTHGDLSCTNIMVHGDNVVGIIDWETAGWYPIYWEYTMIRLQNPHRLWWAEVADQFLEPMRKEEDMETLRLKYFGIFPWFAR